MTGEGPSIRRAGPNDFALLAAIEEEADAIYWTIGYPMMPAAATREEYANSLAMLVAGDPVVGFARLDEVDGAVHLEQLSVRPAWMRRGIGTALIEATCEWGKARGYSHVTLCTFRDVPWNAPFYLRHGFSVIHRPKGQLARLLAHDQDLGMDRIGPRVAMRRGL